MRAVPTFVCAFFIFTAHYAGAMSNSPNPTVTFECAQAPVSLCAAFEQALLARFPDRDMPPAEKSDALHLTWVSEGAGPMGVQGYLTWQSGDQTGRGDSVGILVTDRPGGLSDNALQGFASRLVNALELPE